MLLGLAYNKLLTVSHTESLIMAELKKLSKYKNKSWYLNYLNFVYSQSSSEPQVVINNEVIEEKILKILNIKSNTRKFGDVEEGKVINM